VGLISAQENREASTGGFLVGIFTLAVCCVLPIFLILVGGAVAVVYSTFGGVVIMTGVITGLSIVLIGVYSLRKRRRRRNVGSRRFEH